MEWYSEDQKSRLAKKVWHTYSQECDLTVIMEDIMHIDKEELISTEVKGFYYGEPNDEVTEEYYGKLKANFN